MPYNPLLPSEVSTDVSFFDRFAERATSFASRAPFFAACCLLVVVWAPSYFLFGKVDTWQLVINTATTIITFLMVALLQNSQTRSNQAIQHKLNAIALALGNFIESNDDGDNADARELWEAVGIERRESTT
jgi:low affinity Fe/Cu permease